MSVNWRCIHVMSMPTVLTPLAVSSAHVVKALKEMDSTVQVNNLWIDWPAVLHHNNCSCSYGNINYLLCHSDIDECKSDGLNNCHKSAQCINTEGSFACSCYLGYIGDGRECIGIIAQYRANYVYMIHITLHMSLFSVVITRKQYFNWCCLHMTMLWQCCC